MEGKIDKQGNLWILRGGVLKQQWCPKKTEGPCGGWCPKFGEPYRSYILGNMGDEIHGASLGLCERDQLFFTELEDER